MTEYVISQLFIRLPSYTVQALGNKAWYVELCPLRFQSQDPIPEAVPTLLININVTET